MIGFFLFLLGLCVGSFTNCLVYRLNHNLSLWGWSFCPKCKKKISWYDNIPLLSFFLLRGKCRRCHSPISWQYPLVELATGGLTILIFNPPLVGQLSIINLLVSYALIAIFVSDLLYQTIPDEIVFPAMGVVLLANFFTSEELSPSRCAAGATPPGRCDGLLGYASPVLSPLLAALGAAGFFYFLVLITRGKGMGMGDVKLAGLMGLVLGWPKILVALYLAFLTGALVGVTLVLLGKKRWQEQIPFGPFLAGGTIIALFWGEKIWLTVASHLLS